MIYQAALLVDRSDLFAPSFFLDQDLLLGSMSEDGPMQKTINLLVKNGTWFNNAFAGTPICCPSRAEIQTGRYMHNIGVYKHVFDISSVMRNFCLHFVSMLTVYYTCIGN